MRITVTIDSHLRVPEVDLPDALRRQVLGELLIQNPDRERAISELVRGAAEVDEYVPLWRREGDHLVLPRGYVHRFEQLAQAHSAQIEWDSRMVILPPAWHLFREWRPASLRDYQAKARDDLLGWAQGCYQSATGSGKSRVLLEFIRWAGQKTIVVVGKTSLARQWESAAMELYGYQTGFIGEGKRDIRALTICTWQSLHRDESRETLADCGCIIFDEVHRVSAPLAADLMGSCPAFYRIGASATPQWDPLLWPIVQAVIGPVIHSAPDEETSEHLVDPQIVVVETDFVGEYVPTHKDGRKRVQNNYATILSNLVTDEARNDLIAELALKDAAEGHHIIVATSRIEHVRQIVSRLEHELPLGRRLHVLTGHQTGADAERVRRSVEKAQEGSVLVSTVISEGFDAPRYDRLVLAFPIRRVPLVEQTVGRLRRPAPGKTDAICYDIVDPCVGVFKNQANGRMRLYVRRGWEIQQEVSTTLRSSMAHRSAFSQR